MKGKCECCGKIKDETEVILYRGEWLCPPCLVSIQAVDRESEEDWGFNNYPDSFAAERYDP